MYLFQVLLFSSVRLLISSGVDNPHPEEDNNSDDASRDHDDGENQADDVDIPLAVVRTCRISEINLFYTVEY